MSVQQTKPRLAQWEAVVNGRRYPNGGAYSIIYHGDALVDPDTPPGSDVYDVMRCAVEHLRVINAEMEYVDSMRLQVAMEKP